MGGVSAQDLNSTVGEERNIAIQGSYNALHVRPFPGPQTQAHNRQLLDVDQPADPTSLANVASARESVTWTASENITEVTILVLPSAGTLAAATNLPGVEGAWVVFDASSDAVAENWLIEAEFTSTDSQRYFIPVGVPRVFRFTSNITRADAITANNGAGIADLTTHIVFEAN